MAEIKVLVVSDLHASSSTGDEAETWLTGSTPRTKADHPIIALHHYLETNQVTPDLVLVAGDICNQADEVALTQAWTDLQSLTRGAGQLIATVGNHDIDSRNKNSVIDPRGHLYDLEPHFPVPGDASARDMFWAKNFAIVDATEDSDITTSWRVITLNSAAFHGYTSDHGRELDYGRVSTRTLKRLKGELEERPEADLTILLVHHHPFQLPTVDQGDESRLIGAENLVQLLEDHTPCVLIHGHKHRAFVQFAGGGGANLWVFSAGSMSAFPYGQNAAQGTENQAYILTFREPADYEQLDLVLGVEFQSLSWSADVGWKQCTSTDNDLTLPGRGGFGWVLQNARNTASRISAAIDREGHTRLEYSDIVELEPRLNYLAPAGIKRLKKALTSFNCAVELANDGRISRISRVVSVPIDAVDETRISQEADHE